MDIHELCKDSVADAAEMGAEYCKSVGKTDLAQLTPHECVTLIEVICREYKLKESINHPPEELDIPFQIHPYARLYVAMPLS